MMRVDAVVSAPLGLILVGSRPQPPRAARCGGHPCDSEAEFETTLDLEPETRAAPTLAGRCARCGGQVVGRISFPGDPDEPLAYSRRRSIAPNCPPIYRSPFTRHRNHGTVQ